MESIQHITADKRHDNGAKIMAYLAVFVYEMYATSMLVYAITMQSNTTAIPLTLLAMILIIGPLTGGHVNPAVSTGTFLNRCDIPKDVIMYPMMMVAQFVGASLGAFMYLATFTGGKVPAKFARLYPATPTVFGTFFVEFLGTFFFVTVILLHKDACPKGSISNNLTADGMLAKVSVAVTLAAMIYIGAPYSGACFNPAVAIGLRVLCVNQTPDNPKCTEYTWLYVCATFAGGATAGIFSHLHRVVGRAFSPLRIEATVAEKIMVAEEELRKLR